MPNVGNVGNLVKANDTSYLVQLNQIEPIYVTFSIPERSLEQVRAYAAKGKLKVLAYPKNEQQGGKPAEGVLTFIDNGVDMTTGTVKLKATFPNQDRKLWPGEYVNAALELSLIKDATVVPTKAVQSGQQGDYVYVITPQDTAQSRSVTVSGSYQDLTLLSKGVNPGERVVVNGQLRVAPDAKVVVQNTAASGASPNAPAGGGQ
jgi:multidrug efflux system membrane fusion protein